MKLLLDTANLETIRALLPYMPISGFTTNPSILARESENVKETVAALVELTEGWRMLHIQMTADRAEEIFRQAQAVQGNKHPSPAAPQPCSQRRAAQRPSRRGPAAGQPRPPSLPPSRAALPAARRIWPARAR